MQQTRAMAVAGREKRKRVEAVVETLANLQGPDESLAAVTHDARNMVAVLGLYCDLLEQPGVLAEPFAHYGDELRLVASASHRLVEKLTALNRPGAVQVPLLGSVGTAAKPRPCTRPCTQLDAPAATFSLPDRRRAVHWEPLLSEPIANLAAELAATRNLLSALAGPSVSLTVETEGGARPVCVPAEDLTRVLVNLVKNATEAMPAGGSIRIGLRERADKDGEWLTLTVEDSGPGIPVDALEKIFISGYSAHTDETKSGNETAAHRGLGLSISRSIVEAAGGSIHAENRAEGGARIVMELPECGVTANKD